MDVVRLDGLLAKPEQVYLTDAVPTPAEDGIQLEEHIWNRIEWGYLEANLRDTVAQFGFGRSGRTKPSGRYIHITAIVALKGTGVAYADAVRPEADVLLRMAAHQVTVDETAGDESITYAPRRDGFEGATVYAYGGGLLFKAVGCRAILTSISVMPGQPWRGTFDIWGVLADVDEAALPAVQYAGAAVIPPPAEDVGLTLAGFDPAGFSSFEFRQGMELPAAPRGNAPLGHAGYHPTDIVPTWLATIARLPLAAFDPFARAHAGDRFAWDIGPGAADQYNKIAIAGPAARITAAPPQDQDGFAMLRIEARAENTDPATFDPYTITFS